MWLQKQANGLAKLVWAASVTWWRARSRNGLAKKPGRLCWDTCSGEVGAPTAWDRHLCTRFGVSAVEQIAEQKFGVMVALTPSGIAPMELVDAVDRIRTISPSGGTVRVGRALGISFGGG